jgi:hypothetical protein
VQIIEAALAAAIIFTLIVCAYKLLRGRPHVGATRVGFFIERDYDEIEVDQADQDTKVLWPKEDT